MIKATVKQENSEGGVGGVGVELEFKGTTTNVLYEHAMLTLALLSRLTSRTEDSIERKREMLRMLDAFGAATATLITDGAYKDVHCKVVESKSVVIDHDTISKMRNKEGDDNE